MPPPIKTRHITCVSVPLNEYQELRKAQLRLAMAVEKLIEAGLSETAHTVTNEPEVLLWLDNELALKHGMAAIQR